MIKTMEVKQLQLEIFSNFPDQQQKRKQNNHCIDVYNRRMYIESEQYGKLMGTVISYRGHYLAFCPMDIFIHIVFFEDSNALNCNRGKLLSDFYMDNDDVIDVRVYNRFIENKLSQEKLENVYIKKVIPFMEREGKLQ